jgi:hypothetical protein
MIRLKNQNEIVVDLGVPATQSAAVNKQVFIAPFACQLKAIFAKLGSAGTTGSQIVDVNKNGTTIFSNATKLTFATGVQACTYGPQTANPTQFAKGDIISVDVDQIHTTPAVNLALLLVLERVNSGAKVSATITDAIE